MLTHFSPFLTQKFNTLSLLQRQTCRPKDGWMRAQKEGQGREKARGSVKLKSVSLITQWLKIFELFTGCIVYMFGIFKQNCISCSVTIPVKLLKRNQAKSQAPVCYAVSFEGKFISDTQQIPCRWKQAPHCSSLCQSNYVISEGSVGFNDTVASILRSRSSQSNMHSQ